jgi:5-methylcytosine-specific restriction endonuclease McrA
MSEAAFWGFIRSSLRRALRFWKPIVKAKMNARRASQSDNKKLKWEFQCNHCKGWFPDKQVQVDHIVPVGSLKCSDDLAGFIDRLASEDGFQVLCSGCHQIKTNSERAAK